jgi:hypothetical protein
LGGLAATSGEEFLALMAMHLIDVGQAYSLSEEPRNQRNANALPYTQEKNP